MRVWVVLLLCFFSSYIFADVCTDHRCMAIVDAGSTGTRLHIWEYDLDSNQDRIPVKEVFSQKISPGISSLSSNYADTDNYLSKLFTQAYQNPIPVYFYATAGMRLVSPTKQNQIYATIQQWFDARSDWLLKDLKTLSGKDEALYGWLAMNYKADRLQSPDKTLLSVMDMGGASVQVTFPITAKTTLPGKDIVSFDLYNRHFVLFAHSFLGLGEAEMFHQMQEARACFPREFILPDNSQAIGDGYACARKVGRSMNSVHHVRRIIQPVLRDNPQQEWFMMGSASYLVSTPPFAFNQKFTNDNLLAQAQDKLCQPTWASLYELYPKDEYLYAHCFDAAYSYALMVKGYGISASTPITYIAQNEGADWTLGVLLLKNSNRF